jgi:hypothetical protein
MLITPRLILLVLALACFLVAAARYSPPKVELIALGLALWILSSLIVIP